MKRLVLAGCFILSSLGGAWAKGRPAPTEPKRRAVAESPAGVLHWQQDEAARQAAQKTAHTLLRRPLTIASAVQVALLQNRELQAKLEEAGIAWADLRLARTPSNPEAAVEVKLADRSVKRPLSEWTIAQSFLELALLPLRTRVARAHFEATQLRIADEVVELVAHVKSAVYTAQAAATLLHRRQATVEAQRASLELMQKLHAAGNVPDLRLIQEQAAYSEARLTTAEAELTSRQARERLNRLLGTWGPETAWTLPGELPPIPAELPTVNHLESAAVAQRRDLAAARQSLTSALQSLGLERAFRFLGGLDFGVAGEHEPDGLNLVGPSLSLELPLFNFGGAKIARLEAQLRQSQRRFEQLAIEIRSQVREQRDQLTSFHAQARFYRDELLPMRQQVVALTLLNYNAMLTGAFEVFEAQRGAIEAERGLITTTRDFWVTLAELERTVGGSLVAPK